MHFQWGLMFMTARALLMNAQHLPWNWGNGGALRAPAGSGKVHYISAFNKFGI
jgi:hypothetical protein